MNGPKKHMNTYHRQGAVLRGKRYKITELEGTTQGICVPLSLTSVPFYMLLV